MSNNPLLIANDFSERDWKLIQDLVLQGIRLDYSHDKDGANIDGVQLSRVAVAIYDTIIGAQANGLVDDSIHRLRRALWRHYPLEARALKIEK